MSYATNSDRTGRLIPIAGAIRVLCLGLMCFSCHVQRHIVASGQGTAIPGLQKVGHVVVIYMENHSFDNLYGQFRGADGLTDATASEITQVDAGGKPFTDLPPIPGSSAFPTNLSNG